MSAARSRGGPRAPGQLRGGGAGVGGGGPPAPAAGAGGDPAQTAATTRRNFDGERGAPRDLAALNAGAAIYAAGAASSLERGVREAERAIDSGEVTQLLDALVRRTEELAG